MYHSMSLNVNFSHLLDFFIGLMRMFTFFIIVVLYLRRVNITGEIHYVDNKNQFKNNLDTINRSGNII